VGRPLKVILSQKREKKNRGKPVKREQTILRTSSLRRMEFDRILSTGRGVAGDHGWDWVSSRFIFRDSFCLEKTSGKGRGGGGNGRSQGMWPCKRKGGEEKGSGGRAVSPCQEGLPLMRREEQGRWGESTGGAI